MITAATSATLNFRNPNSTELTATFPSEIVLNSPSTTSPLVSSNPIRALARRANSCPLIGTKMIRATSVGGMEISCPSRTSRMAESVAERTSPLRIDPSRSTIPRDGLPAAPALRASRPLTVTFSIAAVQTALLLWAVTATPISATPLKGTFAEPNSCQSVPLSE